MISLSTIDCAVNVAGAKREGRVKHGCSALRSQRGLALKFGLVLKAIVARLPAGREAPHSMAPGRSVNPLGVSKNRTNSESNYWFMGHNHSHN